MKTESSTGSIILFILSLPIIFLGSIIGTNKNNPSQLEVNKISYLIGAIIANFFFAAIFALIFFCIKRYMFRRDDNTFFKPFAFILLIFSVLGFIGVLS